VRRTCVKKIGLTLNRSSEITYQCMGIRGRQKKNKTKSADQVRKKQQSQDNAKTKRQKHTSVQRVWSGGFGGTVDKTRQVGGNKNKEGDITLLKLQKKSQKKKYRKKNTGWGVVLWVGGQNTQPNLGGGVLTENHRWGRGKRG